MRQRNLLSEKFLALFFYLFLFLFFGECVLPAIPVLLLSKKVLVGEKGKHLLWKLLPLSQERAVLSTLIIEKNGGGRWAEEEDWVGARTATFLTNGRKGGRRFIITKLLRS